MWVQANGDTCDEQVFQSYYFGKIERNNFNLLEWAESEWKCAGICQNPKFFLFSDINKGKPEDGCFEKIYDFAYESFELFMAMAWFSVFLLLVIACAVISINCHAEMRVKWEEIEIELNDEM